MRILVTNDDGINSPGLWSLARALSSVGRVSVVAPDRDMSGVGTAMTLLSVLRAQEVTSPMEGVTAFSVQGTPTDCVILATEALFDEPFDLVASGTNPGANIGLDVLSSGTVGGALQGWYRGIPSMAVSAAYSINTDVRFEAAAIAAEALAVALRDGPSTTVPMVNMNLPDIEDGGVRDVEVTRLGPTAYTPNVERGRDGRRTHYWIRHTKPPSTAMEEGTDVGALRDHKASITSIDLGVTDGVPRSTLLSLADAVRSALGLGT